MSNRIGNKPLGGIPLDPATKRDETKTTAPGAVTDRYVEETPSLQDVTKPERVVIRVPNRRTPDIRLQEIFPADHFTLTVDLRGWIGSKGQVENPYATAQIRYSGANTGARYRSDSVTDRYLRPVASEDGIRFYLDIPYSHNDTDPHGLVTSRETQPVILKLIQRDGQYALDVYMPGTKAAKPPLTAGPAPSANRVFREVIIRPERTPVEARPALATPAKKAIPKTPTPPPAPTPIPAVEPIVAAMQPATVREMTFRERIGDLLSVDLTVKLVNGTLVEASANPVTLFGEPVETRVRQINNPEEPGLVLTFALPEFIAADAKLSIPLEIADSGLVMDALKRETIPARINLALERRLSAEHFDLNPVFEATYPWISDLGRIVQQYQPAAEELSEQIRFVPDLRRHPSVLATLKRIMGDYEQLVKNVQAAIGRLEDSMNGIWQANHSYEEAQADFAFAARQYRLFAAAFGKFQAKKEEARDNALRDRSDIETDIRIAKKEISRLNGEYDGQDPDSQLATLQRAVALDEHLKVLEGDLVAVQAYLAELEKLEIDNRAQLRDSAGGLRELSRAIERGAQSVRTALKDHGEIMKSVSSTLNRLHSELQAQQARYEGFEATLASAIRSIIDAPVNIEEPKSEKEILDELTRRLLPYSFRPDAKRAEGVIGVFEAQHGQISLISEPDARNPLKHRTYLQIAKSVGGRAANPRKYDFLALADTSGYTFVTAIPAESGPSEAGADGKRTFIVQTIKKTGGWETLWEIKKPSEIPERIRPANIFLPRGPVFESSVSTDQIQAHIDPASYKPAAGGTLNSETGSLPISVMTYPGYSPRHFLYVRDRQRWFLAQEHNLEPALYELSREQVPDALLWAAENGQNLETAWTLKEKQEEENPEEKRKRASWTYANAYGNSTLLTQRAHHQPNDWTRGFSHLSNNLAGQDAFEWSIDWRGSALKAYRVRTNLDYNVFYPLDALSDTGFVQFEDESETTYFLPVKLDHFGEYWANYRPLARYSPIEEGPLENGQKTSVFASADGEWRIRLSGAVKDPAKGHLLNNIAFKASISKADGPGETALIPYIHPQYESLLLTSPDGARHFIVDSIEGHDVIVEFPKDWTFLRHDPSNEQIRRAAVAAHRRAQAVQENVVRNVVRIRQASRVLELSQDGPSETRPDAAPSQPIPDLTPMGRTGMPSSGRANAFFIGDRIEREQNGFKRGFYRFIENNQALAMPALNARKADDARRAPPIQPSHRLNRRAPLDAASGTRTRFSRNHASPHARSALRAFRGPGR